MGALLAVHWPGESAGEALAAKFRESWTVAGPNRISDQRASVKSGTERASIGGIRRFAEATE